MWILSCDGDLFEGRKLWLRPASTHLLGRTTGRPENGERVQYINHKSVSRKHLIISVGEPKPGDNGRLHARTEVKVTDGSKIGTTINGDKFSQETKTLDTKEEYTIKLGSYEPLFRLVWRPVVLSFTNLSKGAKSKGDPLGSYKEQLGGVDVKLATDYVTNTTTHVVAKKRNNAPALQALVQARWLVTDAFVDALAKAAERDELDANGDPKMSPLEEDFDSHWPKEEEYLVPSGPEPVPREQSYVKPVTERADVFHDFVFVFLLHSQYDSLMPVITGGGGKAVLWAFKSGQSKVEDLVDHVKELAGRKGDRRFVLSQQAGNGGVVIVRVNEERHQAQSFIHDLDLALDQRSIEQSEFLDAILTVDASGLRKQLPETQSSQEEPSDTTAAPAPPLQSSNRGEPQTDREMQDDAAPAREEHESTQQGAAEEPAPATKKKNRRIVTKSRFHGFDDFDTSQFIKPASQSPEPSFQRQDQSQAASGDNMDDVQPSQAARTLKRPAPVEEEADEEEGMYESMLTGQAALKRRRMEAAQKGEKNIFAQSHTEADRVSTEQAQAKKKRKEKQIDVRAELKAKREREEDQRRLDEDILRQEFDGINLDELKNLAQIEEMEIPVRERPARRGAEDGQSERWDPAWNGRKNFKKFRPQGQRRDGPRAQRVIVTLEEVPRKGHGIGDEYWLESSIQSGRGKSKSQSQSQSLRQAATQIDDDGDDATRFRRRLQVSREEDAEQAADEHLDPDDVAGRPRDLTSLTTMNGTPSQTMATESQRKAAGKRPAAIQGGGPAKKARQTRITTSTTIDLDDDDGDELKFRRKRR